MTELSTRIEEELLPFIEKPLRYTGTESNVIKKDHKGKFRILLAFPDLYEIGMSYQGFQILYNILNSYDHIVCERVYTPAATTGDMMREKKIPLFSLESKTPIAEFDMIGFTLPYELNYSNILEMLDLGNIPFYTKDRTEKHPLIIAGGANAINPEPLAELVDLFQIGDGEEKILEIIDNLIKHSDLSKEEKLQKLTKIETLYIPRYYTPVYDTDNKLINYDCSLENKVVKKAVVIPNQKNYPFKPLVPQIEIAHSDYSNVNKLISSLYKKYLNTPINISFPSIRAETFTEEIADVAGIGRISSFTFAPEAGSDRLRAIINKPIKMEAITKVLDIILPRGWKSIKLYYMIGLPFETDEDIMAMAKMINEISKYTKSYGRINIHVSISPFNPKPHTPFQWAKQATLEELQHKVDILIKNVWKKNIRLDWRNPEVSVLEAIFARGGRELSAALVEGFKRGIRFDGWYEHFDYKRWMEVFKTCNIDTDYILRERNDHEFMPWDIIDIGITKKYLLSEWHKSKELSYTKDCREGCNICGLEKEYNCPSLLTKKEEYEPFANLLNTEMPKMTNKADAPPPHKLHLPKFRIKFKRLPDSRFMSQRDIIRFLERGINRDKIEVFYTRGFHPIPDFSFSHPLSFGFTSETEFADVIMKEGYTGNIKSDMQKLFGEIIELVEVKRIDKKIQSLMSFLNYNKYHITLPEQEVEYFKEKIRTFDDTSTIIVRRKRKKGKIKEFDLKPFIEKMEISENSLFIGVNYIDNQSVRMSEIFELVFGISNEKYYSYHINKIASGNLQSNGELISPMEVI